MKKAVSLIVVLSMILSLFTTIPISVSAAVSKGTIVKVDDVAYKVISGNLTSKKFSDYTRASDGGKLGWKEKSIDGIKMIHPSTIDSGSSKYTMRTFFPIEGGKTYYVRNYVYNKIGTDTVSHKNAGMSAIVATGGAVFGTFSNLKIYSHINYGGLNSWSYEDGPNYIGRKTFRKDKIAKVGLNTFEAVIQTPADAKNIMVSYGAWGSTELYYGQVEIYEVESANNIEWTYKNGVLKISGNGSICGFAQTPWKTHTSAIKEVYIGNGITRIGKGAFMNCSNLKAVSLPKTVTKIEECAFYNCDSLTSVDIPGSVTLIDTYAFYDCDELKKITIPGKIDYLGSWSFSSCDKLSDVTISYGVKNIGDDSFSFCTSLTSIKIPNSVWRIDWDAFRYCTNLKTVYLGSGVTKIVQWAFLFCPITDVYYAGTQSNWNKIEIQADNETLTNANIHYNSIFKVDYNITAEYRSDLLNNAEIEFPYTDDFFVKNEGGKYNHELARATLGLELSAFTPKGADTVSERTANIHNVYRQMGFELEDVYNVNYDKPLTDGDDEAAYTIASKKLYDGSTLVAVVVRGGGYGAEWRSNFHVGTGKYHEGFGAPANDIYQDLEWYIDAYGINTNNAKIWVTGFSRGAAIANIVAGKINENNLVNKENLYVYLFAVPNSVIVKECNANSSKHDNIFNIVLPYDVVPRVAPVKWGFGRYGKTLMVQNRNPILDKDDYFGVNAGQYNSKYFKDDIENTVEEYFEDLTGKQYSIGITQTNSGEVAIKALLKLVGDKKNYVNTYESALMDAIEAVMCYDDLNLYCDKKYSGSSKYAQAEKSSMIQAYAFKYKLEENYINLPNDAMWDYLYPIGIIFYMNGIEMNYWDFLAENIGALLDIVMILDSIGTVAEAHNPEYYISWLYAFDNIKEIYDSGSRKKLTVACPVNVTIYDKNGEEVVKIVENEVITAKLLVMIVGESAEIYLDGDVDDYSVEITAYDEGTVNYSVTEYEDGIETRKINFENIPVETDSVLKGDMPAGMDNNPDAYDLTMNETETISYSESLSKEEMKNITVSVTNEGDGYANGIEDISKGDLVVLEAVPYFDAEFIGWYSEDELLSRDKVYSFVVSEDIELLAKFSQCSAKLNFNEIPSMENNELKFVPVITSQNEIDAILYVVLYDENNTVIGVKSQNITTEDGEWSEEVRVATDIVPASVEIALWNGDMVPFALTDKAIIITE